VSDVAVRVCRANVPFPLTLGLGRLLALDGLLDLANIILDLFTLGLLERLVEQQVLCNLLYRDQCEPMPI